MVAVPADDFNERINPIASIFFEFRSIKMEDGASSDIRETISSCTPMIDRISICSDLATCWIFDKKRRSSAQTAINLDMNLRVVSGRQIEFKFASRTDIAFNPDLSSVGFYG